MVNFHGFDFRTNEDNKINNIYHHIGVYAFKRSAIEKYVNLKRSKLEIDKNSNK